MKDQVPGQGRLSAGWVLPVFFAIVFGGAMVLGPVFYAVVHPFAPVPFHRAMDRAFLVSAVAALIFFWGRIRLTELWPPGRRAALQVAFGYGLAFVSAQMMIGLDLALRGFTSAHLSAGQIAARIGMALLAALLVPPLEETVFRGFVLGELIPKLGRRGACVIAALIFMLAHFLKIPESLDHSAVHFWSGIGAVGAAFGPVVQGAFLGWHGLNLFLIGLILGGVFLGSGSLWIGAGLHSGWIFSLLLFTGLTRPLEPPRVAWLGSGDILSSPVSTLVLMLLAAWLWRYYPPPSDDTPESGENAP
jgi:membrane protease YdiL (CAAX protease family)